MAAAPTRQTRLAAAADAAPVDTLAAGASPSALAAGRTGDETKHGPTRHARAPSEALGRDAGAANGDAAAAVVVTVGAGGRVAAYAATGAGFVATGAGLEAATVAAPTRQMRAASVLGAAAAAAAGDACAAAAGGHLDGVAAIAEAGACAAEGTDRTPGGDWLATAIATGPTRHIPVAVPPLRFCSDAAATAGECRFPVLGIAIGVAALAETAATDAVELASASASLYGAGTEFGTYMAAAPTRHIRGPSVAMPDGAGAGAAAGVTSTDH
jgi:hypothetical protein